MSKNYRPDYNMCSDDAPAVWERERNLSFIQEHIAELDKERVSEMDPVKRELIAGFIFRLEKLKEKISWRARTKLREDELKEYYDATLQRRLKIPS